MDIGKLMTSEQKLRVVETQLWERGAPLDSKVRVRYDGRYGWDFSVVKEESGIVRVTFSLGLGHPRFLNGVCRCARAVEEVKSGKRSEVFAGEGPLK